MKNEERILELLADYIQRLDRHLAFFAQRDEEYRAEQKKREEENRLTNKRIDRQAESLEQSIKLLQQEAKRNNRQDVSIKSLVERTEEIHLSNVELRQSLRDMSRLLMAHHQVLIDKGLV